MSIPNGQYRNHLIDQPSRLNLINSFYRDDRIPQSKDQSPYVLISPGNPESHGSGFIVHSCYVVTNQHNAFVDSDPRRGRVKQNYMFYGSGIVDSFKLKAKLIPLEDNKTVHFTADGGSQDNDATVYRIEGCNDNTGYPSATMAPVCFNDIAGRRLSIHSYPGYVTNANDPTRIREGRLYREGVWVNQVGGLVAGEVTTNGNWTHFCNSSKGDSGGAITPLDDPSKVVAIAQWEDQTSVYPIPKSQAAGRPNRAVPVYRVYPMIMELINKDRERRNLERLNVAVPNCRGVQ